ncbi:cytochrome P450 [Rhizophagus irregularis]|uniref:Cytochrome P450 n=1 Tax=Rhizophagus irregularis TaxID=588596 RepID=A0A2I1G4M3_9GLOM|nr:cytochrome P450 [Rhizophagus irregularis]
MLDLSSLISFFVLGTIVWVIYKIYIWPIYITPLRKIPGPSSENPFYGNLRTFLLEENPDLKWIQKYGSIVKYHGLFNQPTIVIADTKLIQEITLNHVYDYIKPPKMLADAIAIAGRGLVFAEGEDHKRQRKMMNPAFTHNNVKEMVPTFIRVAFTLKNLIEDKVNLGESNINLTPYISKATLDVIGIVGFNYEFNSLTSPNELAKAYDSVTNVPQPALRFAISLLSNYVPYIRNIPIDMNRKFKSACEYLNCVVKETLRLNSPVSLTTRTNIKDKVFGDYVIPKDTVIMVAISALHNEVT